MEVCNLTPETLEQFTNIISRMTHKISTFQKVEAVYLITYQNNKNQVKRFQLVTVYNDIIPQKGTIPPAKMPKFKSELKEINEKLKIAFFLSSTNLSHYKTSDFKVPYEGENVYHNILFDRTGQMRRILNNTKEEENKTLLKRKK